MKTFPILILCIFVLGSCNQVPSKVQTPETPAKVDVTRPANTSTHKDYIYETIDGSDTQIAKWLDEKGNIIETGMMREGKKNGLWTYNIADTNLPFKLVSYVNDVQNGLYVEFNKKGQMVIMANYKNNILHGPWAKFRYGSAEVSVNYVEGKKDGLYRELDFKNGKVKKEIMYKDDKENGFMRFYDPDGNVTVEYQYRNGEKISGGIVGE